MAEGADYKITKLEKGPLQRFKNQNMLLKKFGEVGLQLYKAITGKRTTDELRKDMGMEEGMFNQIIDYMRDAGMIELAPAAGKGREVPQGPGERIPGERFEVEEREAEAAVPEAEAEAEAETGPEAQEPSPASVDEGLAPESEDDLQSKKKSQKMKKEGQTPSWGEKSVYSGAEEASGITPIILEEGPPQKKALKKGKPQKDEELEISPVEEEFEIKPITAEEEMVPQDTGKGGDESAEEKSSEEEPQEGEAAAEESAKEEGISLEPEKAAEEEISFNEDAGREGPRAAQKSELGGAMSPVERIISDKYGDVGLQVYTLIDGQRTAEEIMRDTGLTESKLVEILDFMDEQGIIKLDYPKGAGAAPSASTPMMQQDMPPPVQEAKETGSGFTPMIEGEESVEGAGPVPSPIEIPLKAPLDLVRSVQMKAKIMLKYGDKGGKVFDRMDGKNDLIDISLALGMPLYSVKDIVDFMMQNGMIIVKPVPRMDVRKKYGDDGYAVYKLYGKEGLMLYELIGKELTIKQMAEKITPDKSKIVDMFVFIHKVLGIEIPIDKDVLKKQLGI